MNDPFEQLLRSHRRLEERLEDLSRAAADLGGEQHEKAQAFVAETIAWMDRAVRRHENDEEQSLFPRLAGHPEVAASIARLTDEHRRHEALKDALVAAAGSSARTVAAAAELKTAYEAHIAEEEQVLFPAARRLLDEAANRAIIEEMDARRGR